MAVSAEERKTCNLTNCYLLVEVAVSDFLHEFSGVEDSSYNLSGIAFKITHKKIHAGS